MLRSLVFASFMLFASATPALADRPERPRDAMHRAGRALDANDLASARTLIQSVLTPRSFRTLSPQDQQEAILTLAKIDARDPGCEAALPAATAATQRPSARESDWAKWLAQIYACDDYRGAAAALTRVIALYPHTASGISATEAYRLSPFIDDVATLRFLLGPGWLHEETQDLSAFRLRLIRVLIANEETEEALVVAREFAANSRTDLGSIIEFLSDKVFDPLIIADPRTFTFSTLSERQLANAMADSAHAPKELALVNTLAQGLWDRQRFDEARIVTEDAIARVRESNARHPAFEDQGENLNWTLDLYARILEAYGQTDEALDSMRQAAEQSEDNRVNVSQTLNRVGMLSDAGRSQEALDALDQFDLRLASPYGRAVARSLRVCALADLRDEPAMRAALDDLVAHKEDSLLQTRAAAMCVHDLDLAAAIFLEQLNHPGERRSALIAIQTFYNHNPAKSDLSDIIARPDIAAVIERDAHVRSYPILYPF